MLVHCTEVNTLVHLMQKVHWIVGLLNRQLACIYLSLYLQQGNSKSMHEELTMHYKDTDVHAIFEFGLGSDGVKGQIEEFNPYFMIYIRSTFTNRTMNGD